MALVLVESLAHNKGRALQTAVKALEILFLSAGIISTLLMLKGPMIRAYSRRTLVEFFKSCNCLFSSPVCKAIAINFTVVLIAVSSRSFHRHIMAEDHVTYHDDKTEQEPKETIILPETGSWPEQLNMEEEDQEQDDNEDTMEATWKAITTGSGNKKKNPKMEQPAVKKSETWDGVPAVQRFDSEELFASRSSYRAWKELRKSETFNDAMSLIRRGGLRRDIPTTSHDELNNKVEAFIKKINDNMRLQRQESAQRFLNTVSNRRR